MTRMFQPTRVRVALVLPLACVFALGACGESIPGPGSGSGGASGSGGVTTVGSGGVSAVGSGGAGSGGTSSGGAGSGGTSSGGAGSGGAGSGGTSSGGTSSGGAGSGGTSSGGATSTGPTFHIFMLMGQSNMAGVAAAEASDKTTEERIKVWGGCNKPGGQWNPASPPLGDCPGGSGQNPSNSVDPGTWFAKTLLPSLPDGDTIGLVGTAESGQKIETFISGGQFHQSILNKIAAVKDAENAHFSGIIFHQGESNNNDPMWPGKVVQLYDEVKAAFGVDYDVPFILGELPDPGCCEEHNVRVHEAADLLPMGAWITQQGTARFDEYHFDHASVILMGERYAESMITELGW